MTKRQPAEQAHRSAFSSADYRRYFPAGVFSTLGSWTLRFLLGWSAWELTHSATWVGVTAACMLAPALLLSPLFGIVSDRINPRNGLLLTVGLHVSLSCVAAFAAFKGIFTLQALLVLSIALGIATSAHTPFRLAFLPSLVPRQSLASAIGYSAITFNTSRILGPAFGAWLILAGSPAIAYTAAALLMLGALPFLIITPGKRRDKALLSTESFFHQLRDGLAYTRTHDSIRLVFCFTLINALLGRTVLELLPAFSGKLLAGDSATLATLTASAGMGSIIGGVVVSRQRSSEKNLLQMIAYSLAAGSVIVAALGLPVGLTTAAIFIGTISLITTIVGASSQALAQLMVEDQYRGRVLSLWTMLSMGFPAAGAMLMGWIADYYSFPVALIIFSVSALAGVGWLFPRR
ncbi:MAG: MFS transporter [Pseudomonadales bacterium]